MNKYLWRYRLKPGKLDILPKLEILPGIASSGDPVVSAAELEIYND